MKDWTTACPDWEKRILQGKSLVPFKPLFPKEAAAAREIFKDLKIVDVAGEPSIEDSCRPWVFDLHDAVFGSYDASTGRRLIREFFLLVSKKNSKSTIAAGIMLTALLRNWRKSAELLILAPTLEVANNSFYPARDMVKASPELEALLHVKENFKSIHHRVTGAVLKVVAADNETVSGKKASAILIDELWLFGKRNNAENMLREATGGLVARPEGFCISLSTQSDEPPTGVFKNKLNYFRDVRDGKIEDKKSLPIIYEYPKAMIEKEEHLLTKNFYVTNPNLGLSVDEEWLDDKFKEAKSSGKESLRGFMAKHLNIEVGLALRADRWPGAEMWEDAAQPQLSLEEILLSSEVVVIGIDGGGLSDLLGLCVLGRTRGVEEVNRRPWLCWNRAWCHPTVLERYKEHAQKLLDLERAGDLSIISQPGDDLDEVLEIAKMVDESGKLAQVGLDPYGVGALVDGLTSIGIDMERIKGVSQGFRLMGAIKTVERKLVDKTFRHAGQALMSWCVGNACVEEKGNSILVTKSISRGAKIDPLMATFNATALMGNNPEPVDSRSVYEDHDLIILRA